MASTNILFTLDDDAVYSSDRVVETVVSDFAHPRIGFVAIPHTNQLPTGQVHMRDVPTRAEADFPVVADYAGGVSAKRVDLFLKLGGHAGCGRQGEESTYCIRMLDPGYVVRVASQAHADHYRELAQHDRAEIVHCNARNNVMFAWDFVPWPNILLHLPTTAASMTWTGLKRGELIPTLTGLDAAAAAILMGRRCCRQFRGRRINYRGDWCAIADCGFHNLSHSFLNRRNVMANALRFVIQQPALPHYRVRCFANLDRTRGLR